MFLRELFWLGPFVLLGCVSLVLTRPAPVFPPPAHSRLVSDANGAEVAIPLPFGGVVGLVSDWLQKTHAPEAVLEAGRPRDRAGFADSTLGRIFPQLARNESLWHVDAGTMESVLAHDHGGVYFSGGVRRFGLPEIDVWRKGPIGSVDDVVTTLIRVMNAVAGQPGRSEHLINDYRQEFDALHADLQPETLTRLPRIAGIVCADDDWSHVWARGGGDSLVGAVDAAEGLQALGRQDDSERILAMDPDLIVLAVGTAREFMRDPRWQGLKAVQARRVYQNVTPLRGYTFDSDNAALGERWLAELVHPERLQPKLRGLLREHYVKSYGYRLTDAEIDDLLRVEPNLASSGYARFTRSAPAGGEERVAK